MSKIGTLRSALLELLAEHQRDDALPTSGRFLFYELVARKIISKHPTGKRRADQDMTEALTQLRESGDIPWNWIVDETRSLENYSGYSTIEEGVLETLESIRLEPWAGEIPQILTESRSLAGCLRPVAYEYGIRIAPTNGQCAGFLHTDIVPVLQPWQRVLYLGDFDLCGNDIEANTRRVLEREVGELNWERLALTQEQVERYNLPRIIKTDRRFKNGEGIHEAVETEALSQRLILDIVKGRLSELLPEPLASVQEREERERTTVRNLLTDRNPT
jgi:hypothetical protein